MRAIPTTLVLIALGAAMLITDAAAATAAIKPGKIGIGDSVMLGARPQLRARGFVRVDATVSRQFYDADDRIRHWRRRGLLPKKVILHLGNNGPVRAADCDAAIDAARPGRRVYLVTLKIPRPHRPPSNDALRACARRHANARIVDWYGFSRDHDGWFYADGYHLKPLGRIRYATFVKNRTGG